MDSGVMLRAKESSTTTISEVSFSKGGNQNLMSMELLGRISGRELIKGEVLLIKK